MTPILDMIAPHMLLVACVVAFLAGLIKGAVGFAMPMIMLSGLTTILPPEIALAGLILPTLVSNMMQVARNDPGQALAAMRHFRVFLIVGGVTLLLATQIVTVVPGPALILMLGVVITAFALWQLSGFAPAPGRIRQTAGSDAGAGALVGLIGGASGIWGAPTVAYLTAIGTEKRRHMLLQGVIYGLGSVLLLIGHLTSGILNAATLPFSAVLILPALAGMVAGGKISDRLDQEAFRRATLIVLVLGGLNLLRRAMIG